ncbi:MAG: hypothetical protein LBJ61_04895, partial [Deltaproteobacteria bacterium]|nr:hypothetical protein [Deltaproteobacteria bacterium]
MVGALAPEGGKIGLYGLNPPALARLVAHLMSGPFSGRSVLILAPTALEAEDLAGDLSFFWPEGLVAPMPGLEGKPFMGQVVSPEAGADRLRALETLAQKGQSSAVVAPASALLRLVPDRTELGQRTLTVTPGDEVGFDRLKDYLAKGGYNPVGQVETVADYSVKGGIVDVFPAGADLPVRLDFFGDVLESIRTFGVEDQRSVGKLETLTLVPAGEAPRDAASLEKGAERLAILAEKNGWLWLLWEPLVRRLKEGLLSADLDDWSPLWSPEKVMALDYLGPENPVIVIEPARFRGALEAAYLNVYNHFSRLAYEERPHLPMPALYATHQNLLDKLLAPGLSLYASVETPIKGASPLGEGTALDAEIAFACETNADLKALASLPRRETGLLGPLAARVKSLLGRGLNVSLILRGQEQL